jgi:hypothetical protein
MRRGKSCVDAPQTFIAVSPGTKRHIDEPGVGRGVNFVPLGLCPTLDRSLLLLNCSSFNSVAILVL